MRFFTVVGFVSLLAACAEPVQQLNGQNDLPLANAAKEQAATVETNVLRSAYFGDTHVHTGLSFDAYLMGTRRTPDDAYNFGKGAAIEHASGFQMQMRKPLDFMAVADHAMYLGMMSELASTSGRFSDHKLSPAVRGTTTAEGAGAAFRAVIGHLRSRTPGVEDELDDHEIMRSAWQEIIEAAQRHNDPGSFTTFIGYEYSTTGPAAENLHRNVIFRDANVPQQPFSRFDSVNPEDLWDWMDANRDEGKEAIAIPHNPNGSDGWMFAKTYFNSDQPLDAAYAEQRVRNEPLVENSQVKGTSDTHPLLSPNDEWADYDIMPLQIATGAPSRPQGSYVREAYLNGLLMETQSGFNPFKFGVIGSSDSHNAAGSFEDDNYWSKTGVMDIQPHLRGSVPLPDSDPENPEYANEPSKYWGASGLAGVWAESNTRDAIFDAFRRKETFSTSGSHIKVRFFAGYDLSPDLVSADDAIAQAYAGGVPMGADLFGADGKVPLFYLWAARDPDTQALQRLQVIKGWIEDGQAHERVMDVACSDGLEVDSATQRCPDNGARVKLSDCSTTVDVGDSELAGVWQDPMFDPEQRAFYYVRVLENPSCRWSTYDAIHAGVEPREDMHATIQKRAWSSPIWYVP
ncbi:MAG: DUF3604 domain-containing protein [Gammaproteobacteria bacterium]|nr:DUF3604 domain-containing protein [Gammaproteobacteria bacterium]